jgi:hypothetical protein
MRIAATLSCLFALSTLVGGCSKFAGEWVEEGTFSKEGVFAPSSSDRKAALRFDPPWSVRYGGYVAPAGVVDVQTVQQDAYFEMCDGNVAQFGAVIARVEDRDHLMTYVGAGPFRRFVRVRHGCSIFPPQVVLPSHATSARAPAPAPAAPGPVYASTSPPTSSDLAADVAAYDEGGVAVKCRTAAAR